MKKVDPDLLVRQDEAQETDEGKKTFATILENSWIVTLFLVLMGAFYEYHTITTKGFSLDINGFIFIAFMLGLIFHWRPIRYVRAFNAGARNVGPILLQFPLYGGIMGIMTHTGLAAVIAQTFIDLSTQRTLPFWSFIVPALTFSANSGQRKRSKCHHTGSVRKESGMPTPTIIVSSGGSSS